MNSENRLIYLEIIVKPLTLMFWHVYIEYWVFLDTMYHGSLAFSKKIWYFTLDFGKWPTLRHGNLPKSQHWEIYGKLGYFAKSPLLSSGIFDFFVINKYQCYIFCNFQSKLDTLANDLSRGREIRQRVIYFSSWNIIFGSKTTENFFLVWPRHELRQWSIEAKFDHQCRYETCYRTYSNPIFPWILRKFS